MKTYTYTRRLLATLATGAAGAILAFSGTATAATSQSFQISPPTATYAANPGAAQKGTIKVTNLTNVPLSVRVSKQNFAAKGEEGEIELIDNANPLYSLSPWFNFDAIQLDIPALGTKELHYTVDIPADAEPGGRYGSIVFNTIPPTLPSGQSGAAVQQQIAGIVFQRINGAANEALTVASFKTDKSFYEYGPVAITTRVKNTGSVHEKATGTINIKNMFGAKVASVPLDEHFVIPDAIRKLSNSWPSGKKQPFLIGRYTAELNATYGGGHTLTASVSFIVIPWKLIGIIIIVLIVLFLLVWKARKRFARAIRILAGRE